MLARELKLLFGQMAAASGPLLGSLYEELTSSFESLMDNFRTITPVRTPAALFIGIRGAGKSHLCNTLTSSQNYPESDTNESVGLAQSFLEICVSEQPTVIVDSDGFDRGVQFRKWLMEILELSIRYSNIRRIFYVISIPRIAEGTYGDIVRAFDEIFSYIPIENKYLVVTRAAMQATSRTQREEWIRSSSETSELRELFDLVGTKILFVENSVPFPLSPGTLSRHHTKELLLYNLYDAYEPDLELIREKIGPVDFEELMYRWPSAPCHQSQMPFWQKVKFALKQLESAAPAISKVLGITAISLLGIVFALLTISEERNRREEAAFGPRESGESLGE